MSAELPQLERLIADAAERHYGGRRRLRVPAPRLSLVAGLVAAAAAVVLAIAIFPLSSDEQVAQPRPSDPAVDELAASYGVFAGERTVSDLEQAALDDHADFLDLSKPVTTRLLRRFDDGGIVAVVGSTQTDPKTAVCLWIQRSESGGGSCGFVSELLATKDPSFTFGSIGRYTNEIMALVPDSITSVRIDLKGGTTEAVPIKSNLAYTTADEPICRVTWTTADGRTGHERGPTRIEEATPDQPNPPTCD
jgi:hypothetical protein